ncbi:hypothetical protein KFK09_028600 [Dendrobium nobile]|uniref:Uncharacterized protein n=1 Tax=Dendrobium nobile TaxID=94219 RepID=A0A8T3A3I6_DENNO|nr:hypothetical protein KFK09_028600 [Dendrobium nobile]
MPTVVIHQCPFAGNCRIHYDLLEMLVKEPLSVRHIHPFTNLGWICWVAFVCRTNVLV